MDKPTPSNHFHRNTYNFHERKIPTTPAPEALTPPAPQSMVLPATSTPQPSEAFDSNLYLKIIGDAMVKFSPTGKMSKIFAQLADKFKEKEGTSTPDPEETTNNLIAPSETAEVLTLEKPNYDLAMPHSGNSAALIPSPEREEEVELEGQGDHREENYGAEVEIPEKEVVSIQAKGRVVKGRHEVITLEEDESENNEESLSQRATRKNLRRQGKLDERVPTRRLGKDTKLTAAKLEEEEQRRKGKYIATASKVMKRRSTSQGVVIRNLPRISTSRPVSPMTNGKLM